ncbi:MAG TPA: glucose 1-dehydrogenase [Pedomonas sp.]|uniref:glucose 1-dehydrogenase n=1 Tax=Pedomonas sp. TaxID=2976421 RepID=UPI002F3EC852
MTMSFGGKSVLVTGAGSGIGRETALAFAAQGAKVLVSDITEAGSRTVEDIRAKGGEAVFVRGDVSKSADVKAMVAEAARAFGRLDIAVNNAGIDPEVSPEAEWDEGVFAKVMAVNLEGVFLCMKHEIEQMLAQGGGGSIANVASMAGLIGVGYKPCYTASKHAVVGLTRASALQYGKRGIRVNAVCPAAVDTPILAGNLSSPEVRAIVDAAHPIGRMGQPEDISAAILWLASDQAGFVTGHAMAVDGGLSVQ